VQFHAFAYHIALDSRAVDMNASCAAREYTRHIQVSRVSIGSVHTWEVAMDVYTDAYSDASQSNPKAELTAVKTWDSPSPTVMQTIQAAENISTARWTSGSNKNVAWQNASVFGNCC